MRWVLAGPALALSVPATAYNPQSPVWRVGEEREIDSGWYGKLLYQANGWRVWRFETQQGVFCHAVKPANGRAQPYPLGVGNSFYRGTPRISMYYEKQKLTRVNLQGAESEKLTEWRMPGDRFWQSWSWDKYPDIAALDGQTIEVHVQSWEYPELLVGLNDEKGMLSLVGAKAAMAQAEACK